MSSAISIYIFKNIIWNIASCSQERSKQHPNSSSLFASANSLAHNNKVWDKEKVSSNGIFVCIAENKIMNICNKKMQALRDLSSEGRIKNLREDNGQMKQTVEMIDWPEMATLAPNKRYLRAARVVMLVANGISQGHTAFSL